MNLWYHVIHRLHRSTQGSGGLGRGPPETHRDLELRKRMGEAGREKALRQFTLDRMSGETGRCIGK